MTTTAQYINDLSILVSSGVPLIITKAREPKQVLKALEIYTYQFNSKVMEMARKNPSMNNLPAMMGYGTWDMLDGWIERDVTYFEAKIAGEQVVPKPGDKITDQIAAYDTLLGFPNGIYAMCWPHFYMDVPISRTYLHEIANRFVDQHKKLVLIVPEILDIPIELQDFVSFLNFDVPSEVERFELISRTYESHGMDLTKLAKEDLKLISSAGAGMTGFELGNSVSRAITTIKRKNSGDRNAVTSDLVSDIVMDNKTEMVERSEVLEVMPMGKMSDIGGLDNLKQWIEKRKACFTPEAEAFGVDRPKGVALGGPPGTGKSACAKATGHTLGLPVIKFEFARIFGSLVGQSEQRAKQTLKMLESLAPCVVLLDEVDKIFDVNAGSGDSGVGKRVLGMILTFMQESPAHVFWMFTFNRAEGLPPELLRKGRMDEVFSVGAPDEIERLEIFNIHLKKRKQDPSAITDLHLAVKASEGYVPAELEAAVKEALVEAFHQKTSLTGQLIADHLGNMRALSEAFADQFESMDKWARENARPASARRAPMQTSARKKKAPTPPPSLGEPGRRVIGEGFLN